MIKSCSHASGDFIFELSKKVLSSQIYFTNCLECNKDLKKEFPTYKWGVPLCRKCRIKYLENPEMMDDKYFYCDECKQLEENKNEKYKIKGDKQ